MVYIPKMVSIKCKCRFFSSVFGYCLFGMAQVVLAQAEELPPEPGEDTSDYETVVTANRSELGQFEAPRSIEVVSQKDLQEKQTRSVPEAVSETTGVHLQSTNRGAGSPIIRGLVGPQNLILVDGVRFNTGTFRTGPNQYLGTFARDALQRIEIVRGPASVLYGSGAMGGVLHLITADPDYGSEERASGGTVALGMSTADMAPGGTVEYGGKRKTASLLGGGSYYHFNQLRAGGGTEQPHSDYQNGSWRLKGIYDSEITDAKWIGGYFGNLVRDAGRTDQLGKGDLRFYNNDDHLAYLKMLWEPGDEIERVETSVSYHRMAENIERYRCNRNVEGTLNDLDGCISLLEEFISSKNRYDDTVDTLGLDLGIGLHLLRGNKTQLRMSGGVDLYQDWIGSTREDASTTNSLGFVAVERGNFSDGSVYRTFGAYLFADLTVWDFGMKIGEIHVTGGGRFSNFTAKAPDVPGIGDVTYGYSGFTGAAGMQWLRKDTYSIYASFDQGFRAPNLQETTVLGDTGNDFEIPNAGLKPESSDTVEFGGKLHFDTFHFRAAWFYSMVGDVIVKEDAEYEGQENIDGKPVRRRTNVAQAVYQGVEGEMAFEFWRMTLAVGAAWIKGEIEESDGQSYPARRVPPVSGRAGLRYDHLAQRFYAEFFTRFAAPQDELNPADETDLRICETDSFSGVIDEDCDGTDSWYTLNLRGGARFAKRFRFDVAFLNLTDQKYKLHGSGFWASGFDMRGTLTIEF
jgi:hemoglobin/transferrin/lactoferrin receptor protein